VNATISVLPGDGIGPEVTAEAVRVLGAVARRFGHTFTFKEYPFGGASIDRFGVPLAEEVLRACTESDGILLGAVGGPRWDTPAVRPEQGLLALRKSLDLYANLRPVKPQPALAARSPLKAEIVRGVDILVVRELTGGLYFGEPRYTRNVGGVLHAVDTMSYTEEEVRRVVDLAFRLARDRRGKVTSVDKANVLDTSRLWRKTADQVSQRYPEVQLQHMLVDTMAMRLISSPTVFDVVVTENMFGDILTDEAAVLTGSLGMLPSASLGDGGPGLYEPIHGSAPDIAGKGIANPYGSILSSALLLRHSFHFEREARVVEDAVDLAVAERWWTADLGGTRSTEEVGARVVALIEHMGTT